MPGYIPRERLRDDPPEQTAATRRLALADRKDRFVAINDMCIRAGNAWLTSIAGDIEVTIEATAGSSIPQRLRELNYHLVAEPPGQRIVPHAITERFTRQADGTLGPLVAGSTLPVVRRVTHAGIIEVRRWSFAID